MSEDFQNIQKKRVNLMSNKEAAFACVVSSLFTVFLTLGIVSSSDTREYSITMSAFSEIELKSREYKKVNQTNPPSLDVLNLSSSTRDWLQKNPEKYLWIHEKGSLKFIVVAAVPEQKLKWLELTEGADDKIRKP